MVIEIDIGLIITMVLVAVSIAGWEWNKVIRMKKEIATLMGEINRLHNEHQHQDQALHSSQSDALRQLAGAINRMNDGIDELTHYIRWLGQTSTGSTPPPPLGGARRS